MFHHGTDVHVALSLQRGAFWITARSSSSGGAIPFPARAAATLKEIGFPHPERNPCTLVHVRLSPSSFLGSFGTPRREATNGHRRLTRRRRDVTAVSSTVSVCASLFPPAALPHSAGRDSTSTRSFPNFSRSPSSPPGQATEIRGACRVRACSAPCRPPLPRRPPHKRSPPGG